MPQGLQVFDANQNIIVDLNTRLSKQLGTFDLVATPKSYIVKEGEYTLNYTPPSGSNIWISPVSIASSYGGSGLTAFTGYYYTIERVNSSYKIKMYIKNTASNHNGANITVKFMYGIY